MAARPNVIVETYRRKVSEKAAFLADKWVAAVTTPAAADAYAEGIAGFLGISPGEVAVKEVYRTGVQTKAQLAREKYVKKVSDERTARKWAANYHIGVTRATGDAARRILASYGL